MRQSSFIRPSRLFTADSAIVLYRAGIISEKKQAVVAAALVDLFKV